MRSQNNSGFSLAETLIAILILLIVSSIVATGVPVAKNAYEKVVIGANAKVLLSTAISSLRDEIATARDVKATGDSIEYFSADNGATSRIYRNDSSEYKEIMLSEYIDTKPGTTDYLYPEDKREPRNLISKGAATNDLYITYESVTQPDTDKVVISNLMVCRKSNKDIPLATVETLNIRLIIPSPTSTNTPG